MATATFRGRRCAYEPDYAVPPGQTLQKTIDGIAPGIVVGRLQREGIIEYSNLNRLKVTFRWG